MVLRGCFVTEKRPYVAFDEALTLQKMEMGPLPNTSILWCACLYIARDTEYKQKGIRLCWIFEGTMNYTFGGPWPVSEQDPDTAPHHVIEALRTGTTGRTSHVYLETIYNGMPVDMSDLELLVEGVLDDEDGRT